MTLYLLPNVLGPVEDFHHYIPSYVDEVVSKLDGLIAESEAEGRRFLKRFKTKKKPHQMPIALLNEHTPSGDMDFLLEPVVEGEAWGVVSDGGLPCVADPGARLVGRATQKKIQIEACSGPSSITWALMLSGLPAQQFFFHGYIPKKADERAKALQTWEKMRGVTHVFIEAPYRNEHTLQSCLETLHKETLLCVATSLTLPDQRVVTESVRGWKQKVIGKKPTVFLFLAS